MSLRHLSVRSAVSGLVLLVGALPACGEASADRTGPAAAVADLETVVDEFGRAYVTGDVEALIPLLDPAASGDLSAQELAALGAVGQRSDGVELRDFSSEILERSASRATAVYSGTRCAPTAVNRFPASTVAGGGDAPQEGSSGGRMADGGIVCTDIAETFETLPPVEFVRVGGRWYGTLPGLP